MRLSANARQPLLVLPALCWSGSKKMRKYELTLGSLFSGSGGFELAGLLSGIVPLWNSEIEIFPVRVTSKRLPFVKHYGDIQKLDGAKLPPVDIITFGSPCQDMSIAGKREGLTGERSSLFYEAIRVIAEMRKATNGQQPRYIIWENVTGCFSSNCGDDFRQVLQEICRLKDETVSVSKPVKWANAGLIVGDGFSAAWRVLDAQYFGVPQRRKRIYLVADLGGGRAEQILFESEGLRGDFAPCFSSGKRAAGSAEDSIGETSRLCLNDQGGSRMNVTEDVTCTLRAESHHSPTVLDAPKLYENHSQDTRFVEANDCSPALSANMGLGGNNTPFVVNSKPRLKVYGICSKSSNSMLSDNPRSGFYEAETARTLDSTSCAPARNQGGMAVVSVQGSMIGRSEHNGPMGSGVNEDVSFTLNATDKHAVAYDTAAAHKSYSMTTGDFTQILEEQSPTLMARDYKDPPVVNKKDYIVRKLTPTECARLQGFPDWWCDDLEIENPCEEELEFWREVFDCSGKKKRTDKQILKWLKSPHTDTAEYKMWGNGIALPCAVYVLKGICV